MTQEEITAWIGAGAAVVQAIGAVAAIWASVRLAQRAEARAAESERLSLQRERAAEAASVARADAAEHRADARDQQRNHAKRERIAKLVEQEAEKIVTSVNTYLAPLRSMPNPLGGALGVAEAASMVLVLDKLRAETEETDLLEPILSVRKAAEDYKLRSTYDSMPAHAFISYHDALNTSLLAAVAKLRAAI